MVFMNKQRVPRFNKKLSAAPYYTVTIAEAAIIRRYPGIIDV